MVGLYTFCLMLFVYDQVLSYFGTNTGHIKQQKRLLPDKRIIDFPNTNK